MQTVERALSVLLAFTEDDQVLGVSEIARQLALPKSAVHRSLGSLVATGFVERDEVTSRYRLGPKAVDLGIVAIGTPVTRTSTLKVMQELSRRTRETVTLSMRVGMERIYVSQVEGPRTVRMTVKIGTRCPLYAGASGRVILSFLPEPELDAYLASASLVPLTANTIVDMTRLREEIARVRACGYAASIAERDPWAAAVAAPISESVGRVVEAISICGPKQRFGDEQISEYGQAVVAAAASLSSQTD
jgi:IclR family transcriptional regulator, acetate operon repressor